MSHIFYTFLTSLQQKNRWQFPPPLHRAHKVTSILLLHIFTLVVTLFKITLRAKYCADVMTLILQNKLKKSESSLDTDWTCHKYPPWLIYKHFYQLLFCWSPFLLYLQSKKLTGVIFLDCGSDLWSSHKVPSEFPLIIQKFISAKKKKLATLSHVSILSSLLFCFDH